MSAHIIVLITTGSLEEGRRIARLLVDERLAACVNVVSPIQSVYHWEGKVQEDQEVLLIAKTAGALLEQLAARVKQLHSYDLPEIIALPIIAGANDYLRWIDEETGPQDDLHSTSIGIG
jgi:periplasmic divalent cation tolerance protein